MHQLQYAPRGLNVQRCQMPACTNPVQHCRPVVARSAATELPSAPSSTQRKIAIFVEPSPFSHISGMKNRFESLIKGLREAGDEVMVVTPDPQPPKEFCGAKVGTCCGDLPEHVWVASDISTGVNLHPWLQVVNVLGFKLPFYKSATLLLSTAISVRVMYYLLKQRPDVIHVSTPGIICFAAVLYARLLSVPLVMSYHTHIPEYIPRYTWTGLVEPMWSIIRWCTRRADLLLVTSKAMQVGSSTCFHP